MNTPYRGLCRTNLDDYKRCDWPEKFSRVPIVGERVQEIGEGRTKILRICEITHGQDRIGEFVILELHR